MIVSAAIKYPDGDIISGFDRHFKIIALQAKFNVMTKEGCTQGFMNHRGEFLTRIQAKKEAIAEGQLNPKHRGLLYSEDLWTENKFVGEYCD
jgi:hypothetical protein